MIAERVSRRFTAKEYHQMIDARILLETESVELLDGEILQMPPMGSPHAACIGRFNRLFSRYLFTGTGTSELFDIRIQVPLQLDDYSEPEPDLALVRYRSDLYAGAHPGPEDTFLIVEVAHSTIATDRRYKVPHYAKAGIPETWVTDIDGEFVEAHRKPSPSGYAWMQRYHRGERLAPEAFPELELSVDQILG